MVDQPDIYILNPGTDREERCEFTCSQADEGTCSIYIDRMPDRSLKGRCLTHADA